MLSVGRTNLLNRCSSLLLDYGSRQYSARRYGAHEFAAEDVFHRPQPRDGATSSDRGVLRGGRGSSRRCSQLLRGGYQAYRCEPLFIPCMGIGRDRQSIFKLDVM